MDRVFERIVLRCRYAARYFSRDVNQKRSQRASLFSRGAIGGDYGDYRTDQEIHSF